MGGGSSEVPVVDVVTGTIDRPGAIRRLVESLASHTDLPWRLLVGDASQTPEAISDRRVEVHEEKPRLGHVKGYNKLFRLVKAEFVAWINDDVEVSPGWASACAGFLKRNPRVGIAAIPFREGGVLMRQEWHGMNYASFGFVRREVGERLGWYDEDLWMYGGDNSMCFRALAAGLGVAPATCMPFDHFRTRDEHRPANEATQDGDTKKLTAKFKPHFEYMRRIHDEVIQSLR